MEYIYAAMILHTTEQDINEENVTKILEAAGANVDESRVKALIAALEDVDIEEAMETTAMAAAPAAAAPVAMLANKSIKNVINLPPFFCLNLYKTFKPYLDIIYNY